MCLREMVVNSIIFENPLPSSCAAEIGSFLGGRAVGHPWKPVQHWTYLHVCARVSEYARE